MRENPLTPAGGSRCVGKVVSGVCVCVFLYVCPRSKRKTACAINTQLGGHAVYCWQTVTLGSKVKITRLSPNALPAWVCMSTGLLRFSSFSQPELAGWRHQEVLMLRRQRLTTQLQQAGALLGRQGDRRRVAAALRAVAGTQRRHGRHVAQSTVVVGARRGAEQAGRPQSEVAGAAGGGVGRRRLVGCDARARVGRGRYPADSDEGPAQCLVCGTCPRLHLRGRRRVGHAQTLHATISRATTCHWEIFQPQC